VHGYIYVQAENTGKNPIPSQKNITKNSIKPCQCDGLANCKVKVSTNSTLSPDRGKMRAHLQESAKTKKYRRQIF